MNALTLEWIEKAEGDFRTVQISKTRLHERAGNKTPRTEKFLNQYVCSPFFCLNHLLLLASSSKQISLPRFLPPKMLRG